MKCSCSCSDVERVLPELLDAEPDRALESAISSATSEETRLGASDLERHLRSCPACAELVSDLKLISSEARQLAATEEPAPRLWARIAAELRAEELIFDPAVSDLDLKPKPPRPIPILVPASPLSRWSAWWLAPVAAAIVAAGSYVISHNPAPQIAKQPAPATAVMSPARPPSPVPGASAVASSLTAASAPAPVPQQLARKSKSATPTDTIQPAAEPESSENENEEDRQFLSEVSTRAPSMRATYETQLKAVNDDIRETQAYVNLHPGDAEARQHLMDDYQQKALLYQMALDRIQ